MSHCSVFLWPLINCGKEAQVPAPLGEQGQPCIILHIILEALWLLMFLYISIFPFLCLWNFDRIYTLMWLFHFEACKVQLIWMLTPAKLSTFQNCRHKEISSTCFLHKANESNELFHRIILDVHISLVKNSKWNCNLKILNNNLYHELLWGAKDIKIKLISAMVLGRNVLLNHKGREFPYF